MTSLEIVAAIAGFLCVYFYIVRNVWSWPMGLVQVILLIAVFLHAKLYADMVLHVLYVVLQFYGWWAWHHSNRVVSNSMPREDERVELRSLTLRGNAIAIASTATMTIVFTYALTQWTNAELPMPDSFVAAASLVAQFLLAGRYIENWLYWIVVDTVGIGLFAYKELYPTAILYGFFWLMAVIGFVTWRRSLRGKWASEGQHL
jgi:nicotinamide mononucleotide transporter